MKLRWWIVGYLIALAAAALSPFASGAPDGLERVAQDKGFDEAASGPIYETIPGYLLPAWRTSGWRRCSRDGSASRRCSWSSAGWPIW